MSQRGEQARQALIEVAERLFAERGIESVSLRDISAAAGQRNHSAAQYHFGDRAGLVAAVFEHRMSEVDRRRNLLLDDLETIGSSDDLARLVEATIRPLVDVVAETDGWYGRFLVRVRWDGFARGVLADLPAMSSFRRAIDLISDQLETRSLDAPALDARQLDMQADNDVLDGIATGLAIEVRSDRIDQMTTLFIGTIAGWEWRRHNGRRTQSPDELCADLTATCHAVLTARVAVPSIPRSR